MTADRHAGMGGPLQSGSGANRLTRTERVATSTAASGGPALVRSGTVRRTDAVAGR